MQAVPGAAAPAVHDVSFTVADREFMVLLGPSGCGKSTVLRMIAGLEPITSGTVAIDGRVVNEVPAKLRDIAMVFQSYALYPHMTVYDNLAFGLRRRDIEQAEIDRRVNAAAKKLGLAQLLQRKPHALSGGQRQRVALGRAIVRDPRVFLFDEPLSNLDAALRVTTRNEADQTAARDRHDIDLRDARPGRGDDDGPSHLHHERGQGRADWPSARGLPKPGGHVRGQIPRQSADEPVAGTARRAGRRRRRAFCRRRR